MAVLAPTFFIHVVILMHAHSPASRDLVPLRSLFSPSETSPVWGRCRGVLSLFLICTPISGLVVFCLWLVASFLFVLLFVLFLVLWYFGQIVDDWRGFATW